MAFPDFLKEYSISGDYLKETITTKINMSDKSLVGLCSLLPWYTKLVYHRKLVHIDLREYTTAFNSIT